jgi:hypothetical protein
MNRLQLRLLGAAAFVVAAGIAAYWYWSPYLAVRELREAAMNADAVRFNERVDFPRLRDSLKAQLVQGSGSQARDGDGGDKFGGMLANALVGALIDAAVRPETIMVAMREGRFKVEHSAGPNDRAQGEKSDRRKPVWHTERRGFDTVLFHVRQDDGTGSSGSAKDDIALVMQRHGFADWKLTDIRLPD